MNVNVALDRKDAKVTDMVSDLLSHKSCTECDRLCNSYKRLKKHYKKRHGDLDIHQCPFCQFVTPTAKALSEHKKLSHREVVIFCLDCDFSTKKWLKWCSHLIGTNHRMKQSETQILSCPVPKLQCHICDYAGHSYKRLKKHYHKHHKEQVVFKCPFCEYMTVELPKMKHHKKTSHPQEQICCSLCDFSTRKWTKWIHHQENGHSDVNGANDKCLSKDSSPNSTDVLKVNKCTTQISIQSSMSSICAKASSGCLTTKTDLDSTENEICKSRAIFTKSVDSQWTGQYTDQHSVNINIHTSSSEGSIGYVTSGLLSDIKHNAEKEIEHDNVPLREPPGVARSTELRTPQLTTCSKTVKLKTENVGSDSGRLSFSGTRDRDLTVAQQLCNAVCSSAENVGKYNSKQPSDSEIHRVEGGLSVESDTAGSCDKSSDVGPFVCETCQKSFKLSIYLKRHVRIVHSGVRKYVCGKCSETFKTSTCLKRHQVVHFSVRNFVCSECGKAYKRASDLNRHQLVHLPETCFKCPQCYFASMHRAGMKYQVNHHLGQTTHICTVCGKSYTCIWIGHLRHHMRRHTGITLHKCQFCDYTTVQLSRHRRHLQIHLNIKPYKCADCDFSSTHKENLEAHMRTHTGEKPFVCPVCGKCFSRKHDMQRHTMAIHFKDFK